MLTAVTNSASALEFVALAAHRAPRLDSTADWEIVPAGYTIQFRSPEPSATGSRRFLIDCGSAVEFARYAVRSLGRACIVRVMPNADDPSLLATLTETHLQEPTPAELSMIVASRTADWPRQISHRQMLLDDLFASVQSAARDRGCWVRRIEAQAPGSAPSALSRLDPSPGRQSEKRNPAAWLLIGTDTDDASAQLRTGRTFAQIVLSLRTAGLRWCPLVPVPETPRGASDLSRELGLIGMPQLVLEVGG